MMAINFTKAIELQVVRKLKSHAKVGYQDHPRGDKYCSNCTMFVDGNPPACTHVAPPIASHGYCDDHEPVDLNAKVRAAFGKAFNPDQPRDDHGKWEGGNADHPDWMHGEEGGHLASAMQDVSSGMHDSADKVEEARQALEDASGEASDHSEEEPDSGSKEYAAWEKQNNANLENVANKTMELHQAVSDHMTASMGVLGQLSDRINVHARENGVRAKKIGKNMTVGDVHATTALGNQSPNKRKAKDFLTTIGEVKGGARVVAVSAMDFGKALEKIKVDAAVDFMGALVKTIGTFEFRFAPKQYLMDFSKGRTVNVLFMRHGPTRFNNQTDMSKDRVHRGRREGRREAQGRGDRLHRELGPRARHPDVQARRQGGGD